MMENENEEKIIDTHVNKKAIEKTMPLKEFDNETILESDAEIVIESDGDESDEMGIRNLSPEELNAEVERIVQSLPEKDQRILVNAMAYRDQWIQTQHIKNIIQFRADLAEKVKQIMETSFPPVIRSTVKRVVDIIAPPIPKKIETTEQENGGPRE